MSLAALETTYHFPLEEPKVVKNNFGWFGPPSMSAIGQFLNEDTKLVLEIGSFLGKSTRWILDNAPNAKIICIDTWLGSVEHHISPEAQSEGWFDLLPNMHETFIKNLWDYRDRVIPIRATSNAGLEIVKHYDAQPDLIFIDGAHDYPSVIGDFKAALDFPGAQIVGDDIRHPPVREAVTDISKIHNLNIQDNNGCWWVENAR